MINHTLKSELTGREKFLFKSDDILIASACISDFALDFILEHKREDSKLKLLLGVDLPSSISALEKLKTLEESGQLEFRLFIKGFFHPKLYLLKNDKFSKFYVGSGNFTKGGLQNNVELFHPGNDQEAFGKYEHWFDNKFNTGIKLTDEGLSLLREQFEKRRKREKAERKETKTLKNLLEGKFNLEAIDFTGQYFSKADHETFSPDNRFKEKDEEVEDMRIHVRRKLYDLHDILEPEIKILKWKIEPHYVHADIVSRIEPGYRKFEVAAMWLHYGRGKKEIKRYGKDETPLFFSRLQVIIRYDEVGTWLRFGKKGGSRQDREYFKQQMRNPQYRQDFFKLLTSLDTDYWIRVGNESTKRPVNSFQDFEELWELTKTDDWKTGYFIIGRSFDPGDKKLSKENIIDTVVDEFGQLYPIYRLMKDKSFEEVKI